MTMTGCAVACGAVGLRSMFEVWKLMEVPEEAPPAMAFEDYASSYFNLNRKGMFGKKTTVDKVAQWKPVRLR
jgi:hypothetical protein